MTSRAIFMKVLYHVLEAAFACSSCYEMMFCGWPIRECDAAELSDVHTHRSKASMLSGSQERCTNLAAYGFFAFFFSCLIVFTSVECSRRICLISLISPECAALASREF